MRASADAVICAVSASAAQRLMRRYCSARPAESACGVLGIRCEAAQDRLALFEAEGCPTRENSGSAGSGASWLTTGRGDARARTTSGKPGRVTAGRHLEQVVARARAYNADPGRLLTIASITVLGNGLDPSGCYGCLELAVSAVRRERDPDLYVRKVLAYARSSGRRFGAFHELIYWPDRELRMILKNRSPAISFTEQGTGSLAGRLELVYTLSENPGAIASAPDVKSQ